MFQTTYQPLSIDHPEWGTLAILPWDTEIFGFAVADFKPGNSHSVASRRDEFVRALAQWTGANRVELISASIPAEDILWVSLLQELNFLFVDSTLEVINKHVQRLDIPATRNPLRPATREDQAQVEHVAEGAFRFGRYHADARFPRALADLRYRRWLHNAFASLSPQSIVYVTGAPDHIRGFLHVNINERDAYMTIAAVEKSLQGGVIGYDLIAETLRNLKAEGIQRVHSKVSAVNTAIVNIAISFDGRFAPVQAVFHWHAPNAPHLVPQASLYT